MAWTNVGSIRGPVGPQGNTGPQGPAGDTGPAGTPGARGTKWFTGSGAPSSVPGSQAGDFYLNTDNGDVYELS